MKKILVPIQFRSLLISFILTAIFLTNFLFNLSSPMYIPTGNFPRLGLSHTDEAHVLITLRHYMDVFGGNFNNLLDVNIFYGFKDSLLYSEPFFLQAIFVAPFYFLTGNIITSFHIVAYLTIVFSLYACFLYVYFLTKNFWASILASIIFVYNPFLFGRFPEHISYYSLMFIPLIFLSFEKFLKNPKFKYSFFFFLFLTLNILASLTFGVLLSLSLPIYMIVRIKQTNFSVKRFINKGTILGGLLFLGVVLAVTLLYLSYYSKEPIGRSLSDTAYYSAWLSDFFIASANNLLYGGSRQFIHNLHPSAVFLTQELAEHNLFAGIIPLVLLILSFKFIRSKGKGFLLLCLGLLFLSVILSMGPEIYITDNVSFWGPYLLLYKIYPILHFLRVASRFGIFYFFFLGIVAALVVNKLMGKLDSKRAQIVALIIIGLVLVEYWNKSWDFMQIPSETKQFYANLEAQKDIKVILELPIGDLFHPELAQSYNQSVDAYYMLYASTLHSKWLINGYSSYTPKPYIQRLEYLSINFPTTTKLETLKTWGVDAIILHKEKYAQEIGYENLVNKLIALGVPQTISNSQTILFDLTKWNSK